MACSRVILALSVLPWNNGPVQKPYWPYQSVSPTVLARPKSHSVPANPIVLGHPRTIVVMPVYHYYCAGLVPDSCWPYQSQTRSGPASCRTVVALPVCQSTSPNGPVLENQSGPASPTALGPAKSHSGPAGPIVLGRSQSHSEWPCQSASPTVLGRPQPNPTPAQPGTASRQTAFYSGPPFTLENVL